MHLSTPLAILLANGNVALRRDARTFSRFMALEAAPRSPQANALIASITNDVIIPFQSIKGQVRPSMVEKYPKALGPFMADLLQAAKGDRWGSLATRSADLVTYPGGRAAFATMREAMGADGLLEELRGYGSTTGNLSGASVITARHKGSWRWSRVTACGWRRWGFISPNPCALRP